LFGNPQKGLPIFPKNETLGSMSKISYGFRTSLILSFSVFVTISSVFWDKKCHNNIGIIIDLVNIKF